MAICWRTVFPVGCFAILPLLGTLGCTHQMSPNPYAPPGYGNPWASPNAAQMPAGTTLPPPPGQPSAVPAYPAAPNLPPPQGVGAPGLPAATPNAGIRGPDWNNPGTMSQQQQRANVFDPFANNEMGPEIVGGRPRDFQKPMNEATRAHEYRDTRSPF